MPMFAPVSRGIVEQRHEISTQVAPVECQKFNQVCRIDIPNKKEAVRVSQESAAASLLTSLPAIAQVELHVLRPSERARAADVNGNFTNLKNAVEAAGAAQCRADESL
jgi:hypothetical protein